MSPGGFVLLVLVSLAICVQCLPVEPKFKQMTLQAQESQTSTEIQAISSRITFLQKLNKLTYDTTLFTRKLRWLLRRSLTEKPSVAQVAELMAKELEISKAQIDLAVEGVADELKLEVKQGIIALKAGLAFIKDNYKAGSDPQADAIIAHIEANLAALEARFGKTTGPSVAASTGEPVPSESSTTEVPPPVESSTASPPPTAESSTAAPPPTEQSTTQPPPPEQSTTQVPTPTEESSSSGAGSLIGGTPTAPPTTTESSTVASLPTPTAESSTALPPAVTLESSTGSFNQTNSSSSTAGFIAESPLSSTAAF